MAQAGLEQERVMLFLTKTFQIDNKESQSFLTSLQAERLLEA